MAKVRPCNLFFGPFLQPEIWSKNFNKNIQRKIKAKIVTLSSLIWNSAARDQKSLATPDLYLNIGSGGTLAQASSKREFPKGSKI